MRCLLGGGAEGLRTCEAFGKAVFAEGALPARMNQIIAVAVAHVT